jgi:cysteinyl-tRNA synthetase
MKKIVPVLAIMFLAACNNAGDASHEHGQTTTEATTPEDSLMKLVMAGHDAAMPKMSKLSKAQTQVQHAIDSINRLPGKFRQAAEPYQRQLDSLMKDLQYAENSMNRWMEEFAMDTLENEMDLRLKYLQSEQQKVTTVKENIFSDLQKADSLLKK